MSQSLTQTAGAETAAKGDDRYTGDVVVNVTRANHKGLKGEQTLTLTNGRVKWYDANGDGKIAREEFLTYQAKIFDMMDTGQTRMLGQNEFFGKGPANR